MIQAGLPFASSHCSARRGQEVKPPVGAEVGAEYIGTCSVAWGCDYVNVLHMDQDQHSRREIKGVCNVYLHRRGQTRTWAVSCRMVKENASPFRLAFRFKAVCERSHIAARHCVDTAIEADAAGSCGRSHSGKAQEQEAGNCKFLHHSSYLFTVSVRFDRHGPRVVEGVVRGAGTDQSTGIDGCRGAAALSLPSSNRHAMVSRFQEGRCRRCFATQANRSIRHGSSRCRGDPRRRRVRGWRTRRRIPCKAPERGRPIGRSTIF